jgi:hypothetical protein
MKPHRDGTTLAGKGSELCGSKENRRDRLGLVSLVQERLQSRSMKEEVGAKEREKAIDAA